MDDAEKAHYRNKARQRPPPDQIVKPGPDQESVWDYPRPPRVERVTKPGLVMFNGHVMASSTRLLKVMETASPPTYYFPPDDVDLSRLIRSGRSSFCEWKGEASYWRVSVEGERAENVAWSYQNPLDDAGDCALLRGYFAFYPHVVDCKLGDDEVYPQQGSYYGGWITPNITGPFKGAPDTKGW